MKKLYQVPEEVTHSYFYSESEDEVFIDDENMDSLHPVFSYEILYYNDGSHLGVPWGDPVSIRKAEGTLTELREKLNEAFSRRASVEVKALMKKAAAQFIMYLFWSNGKPVNLLRLKEELQLLSIKPVNVAERLDFVLTQPSLFHSYKQLDQMFIEQTKQYAKNQALQKHRH
ncbi:YpoC family protein [Rossellomorea vietnamensis]|uniref:YpoC family protein n=1 Tax=Rossellomorea vietnamensis TaxID=218284 RepID=UPI003CF00EFC